MRRIHFLDPLALELPAYDPPKRELPVTTFVGEAYFSSSSFSHPAFQGGDSPLKSLFELSDFSGPESVESYNFSCNPSGTSVGVA